MLFSYFVHFTLFFITSEIIKSYKGKWGARLISNMVLTQCLKDKYLTHLEIGETVTLSRHATILLQLNRNNAGIMNTCHLEINNYCMLSTDFMNRHAFCMINYLCGIN